MKKRKPKSPRYVVCIRNNGYPASLEPRKIYRVLRDPAAAEHECIQVIDESGDDYVYPADYFIPVAMPKATERAISAALAS